MDATAMLREFCDAVERQDGRRFADLFCEDGVYHDAFYGEFVGQEKNCRDDQRLVLQVRHGYALGYARSGLRRKNPLCSLYFSYTSLLPEASGRRAMFEGVAIMRLRDGRIADYREVANTGPGFRRYEFRPRAHRQNFAPSGRCAQGPP